MASESTEESTLTVSLPPELDDWLGDRADSLDVDRESVLLQLLASYRAASELDDDSLPATESLAASVSEELETQVESQLEDHIQEAVTSVLAETLDERVGAAVQSEVQSAVDGRLAELRESVDEQVDAVETKHTEDIEDVRSRVVQMKRELDGKAPAGHDHEEFDRVKTLGKEVETLRETVEDVEDKVDTAVSEHDEAVEDIDERLDSVQDRLKTVAWVVSDLREAHESQGGVEAVDRIKRAAAKADVERANCESCGNGVNIGLLTEPECPHCQATVTNVEPASGFFSKPQLLTASQLESGGSNE